MKSWIKGTKGLTIIELAVVMCILSVMVMISIPNVGRWLPRYRLRSAVRDMASSMQLARLAAIKENREWAIQFDTNAHPQTYTILSDEGADGAWGTADDTVEKVVELTDYPDISFGDNGYGSWLGGPLTGDLEDGVTFRDNRVEFRPDGTAKPDPLSGLVGSAYFQNNRGDAACARIRFSGSGVEVVHWDGDSWEP